MNREQRHEPPFKMPIPQGARRIAWNGVSFCVPSNWEMAVYRFLRRGACRIELEDEYSVRIEAEWIRARNNLKLEDIMERYAKASKPLTLKAEQQEQMDNLPKGWHATRFVMQETDTEGGSHDLAVTRHELVTAFYLSRRTSLFCFFLLHFSPGDAEDPESVLKTLAGTFEDHYGAAVFPWELFDISFSLPKEFILEKASFDIGCKKLVFKWRSRRLYLWYFSCTDILLKDTKPDRWLTGYLNAHAKIRAVRFWPDKKGGVTYRRKNPYLLGHRTEIARMCFRYDVGFRILEEKNMLVSWVFHYRSLEDLQMLKTLER